MVKKLDFKATAPVEMEEDSSGSSRDIWLAAWGVVAIFVIVILVLFFTGNMPTITGAGTTLVPEQNACQRGNAVTDLSRANQIIASGGVCTQGLLPYIKCCWWP
ncbi:MAG: hypothetical protein QXM31_00730 [Candidatus Woesearchaeota archaeon]